MTDIETLQNVIEFFLVEYFNSIDLAGTVKHQHRDRINYFSIDLRGVEWDENIGKLHNALAKHLRLWGKNDYENIKDYIAISKITIEYLLPEKDSLNQNKFELIRIFYIPQSVMKYEKGKEKSIIEICFNSFWKQLIVRNLVLTSIPVIVLTILGYCMIGHDECFKSRLGKSFEYLNTSSGVIASLSLAFIMNKVSSIRQDKLRLTNEIMTLSNQFTCFRNICYNLVRDHVLWSKANSHYDSYQYAESIKNDITYEQYMYPNYRDEIEYANYMSFYKENISQGITKLVLQLHMMADDSFLSYGLTYTKFPSNYIYSHEEMKKFILFSDSNQIWYCASELKAFPDTFRESAHMEEIKDDIKRIYPENKFTELTSKYLEEVSLDFQLRNIPRLFNLTKAIESKLPQTIRYFTFTFILLLLFGIIIPTLMYIFIMKEYAFLCVFAILGIISHIILTLPEILDQENKIDEEFDYL